MRVNLLHYAWKGVTSYSYAYALITNNIDVPSIIEKQQQGIKVVLFGWTPLSYPVVCALEKAGINVDIVCGFNQQCDTDVDVGNDITMINYHELMKEPNRYFFIAFNKNDYNLQEIAKFIQYSGVDEFGIIAEDYTKDFSGNKKLQKAFFESLNETFAGIDLINNWDTFYNLRRSALTGAGYWDVPYSLIYRLFKSKKKPKYLEIGPGMGIMALSLKKLMDIDETWITIPNEEKQWLEWRRPESIALIKNKYNVKIKEGFIETDTFDGKYDIIVMAQVMEHLIFNPVNTISKLAEMLDEDGAIYICVPQEKKHFNVDSYKQIPYPDDLTEEQKVRRTKINNFGHYHEYSYDEAMEVFTECGLECAAYMWTAPVHHFMLKKKK